MYKEEPNPLVLATVYQAVPNYQKRFKKVEKKVTTLGESVSDVVADVAGLTEDVGTMQNDIDALEEAISHVTAKDIYSTTEQVIGEWIDGKPIYRKVIVINSLPNAGEGHYLHYISDIEEVTAFKFTTHFASNEWSPVGGTISPLGLQFAINASVSPTDIVVRTGTDRTNQTAKAVIEYTKTTDTVAGN